MTRVGQDGRVEVDSGLLGRRVALRFRVGERAGRPLYQDAVGELSADGDTLVVLGRRGPVRVDRSTVVAVRAVPPAPPRRAALAAVARLEGLCADAWPAQHEQDLGAWRLRAAGGYTGRANSALALGDPGVPVAEALRVVRAFATEHAIPPRVQAPIGSPWDRAVHREGWLLDRDHRAGAEVAVMVADLDALRGDHEGVTLAERPSATWWQLGNTPHPTPAQRAVLDPGPPLRTAFALVNAPNGDPVGRLRAAAVDDHLHLSAMDVLPTARRNGRATTLLRAAADWGVEHAARWAVLQVALHNSTARALYDSVGFTEHHRYRYLVPPT